MSDDISLKPPTWFWIVAALALVWNLLGVFAYLGQVFATPEMLDAMTADQRALMENTPAWATGAFAIAVWGGALGCILLLLRKKLSKIVFVVSLIGILVQMYYNIFMSNSMEVYGPGGLVMPIMVLLVGIGLIWMADMAEKREWIN